MIRCKIAKRLWDCFLRESENAEFTGYAEDMINAYDEYVTHIQDCGCWKNE